MGQSQQLAKVGYQSLCWLLEIDSVRSLIPLRTLCALSLTCKELGNPARAKIKKYRQIYEKIGDRVHLQITRRLLRPPVEFVGNRVKTYNMNDIISADGALITKGLLDKVAPNVPALKTVTLVTNAIPVNVDKLAVGFYLSGADGDICIDFHKMQKSDFVKCGSVYCVALKFALHYNTFPLLINDNNTYIKVGRQINMREAAVFYRDIVDDDEANVPSGTYYAFHGTTIFQMFSHAIVTYGVAAGNAFNWDHSVIRTVSTTSSLQKRRVWFSRNEPAFVGLIVRAQTRNFHARIENMTNPDYITATRRDDCMGSYSDDDMSDYSDDDMSDYSDDTIVTI